MNEQPERADKAQAGQTLAAAPCSATGRIKTDRRPPLGGWANGNYWCKCCECGETFVGDKRAVQCADCAYAKSPNEKGQARRENPKG